jgi:hypothetical protein
MLLIGAIIVQFPSEREISFAGIFGFGSASLYIRMIVPKGTQAHNGLNENRTAPGAIPPVPCQYKEELKSYNYMKPRYQ